MSGVSEDQSLPRIPEMGSDERAMLREFAGILREHRVRNQVARHGLDIVARELENLSRPV
ncbi:MAG: hypothetical protein Q8R44_13890 [Novosphingobium sp.]|nr:hypothetical protein [Novosphingobium sp.]